MARETPNRPGRKPLTCWFAGLATLDVIHRAARPERDQKVTAVRQDVAAGGPAASAAVTAAALGARAVLVTALGTSAVGTAARADLERYGVEVHDVATPGHCLAVSAVLVDKATGERSVVSADGALTQVAAPGAERLAGLPVPDVVLLDGHHPDIARAVLAHVRAMRPRPTVLIDAGRWRPVFGDLLPAADVVACSAAFRVPAGREAWFAGLPGSTVVTHGAGPVDWRQGDATGSIEVPGVDAVDTLGAGDAFHGALAVELARGTGLRDACTRAVDVASLRVQHLGPRSWLSHLGQGRAVAFAQTTGDAGIPGTRSSTGDDARDPGGAVGRTAGDFADGDFADGDPVAGERDGGGLDAVRQDAGGRGESGSNVDGSDEDGSDVDGSDVDGPDGGAAEVRAVPLELVESARRLVADPGRTGRAILGITGPPGAGKSTLATGLAEALGPELAVVVGMDGFHLANAVLEARGRRDRKGAIDTFDDAGYAELIERIATARPGDPVVLAPEFRREIEEPVANAVPVSPEVPLVITEGNYLLAECGRWPRARARMSEVWYVDLDDDVRLERLTARHHAHGKSPEAARAWAHGSDQRNADLVTATRERADRRVRL